MNWGNHLHGQVSPAKSPGPGASRSIHLPSRHYCQRGRCHIPGIRERREHNRDFPTKPSYFRCDSVAICRDRTRQSQKLLSQPPPSPPPPLPGRTRASCPGPCCRAPEIPDLQPAALPAHGRQHPAALPSVPADPSIPAPRHLPRASAGRYEREGSPFSGRGCSEGGIQRIPALPMEPLCASAAPDLSPRRRLAGS